MKRTLKYALSAVLTAAIVMPAFAQDNFPDVPDNHWAFEALVRMKKDGLLVGYPDGLFRGGRPASRYELAVAMHAVYMNLKSVTDGLDAQIKALSDKLNGVASTSDIQNLRDALTALQNEVAGMKSYGDDIANLKRMADTFQKELQSLGVDVEAMKRDLKDIDARLTKVESRKPAVNISGDLTLFMLAGNSRDGRFGLDRDGRTNGVDPVTGKTAGMTKDNVMLQEGAFTFAGTNETGPKWKGTLVVGNMLDTFGGQSLVNSDVKYTQGNSDVYLQDFSVKFDTSVAGLAFSSEVGRVSYKVSPYLFQRIDSSTYLETDRWDDGMYRLDGGIFGFNIGGAKLEIVGGNTSKVNSVNGIEISALKSGYVNGAFGGLSRLVVDRTLGANFVLPVGGTGDIDLAYLIFDSNQDILLNAIPANRLTVYGGDAHFKFGKLGISGGYSKSDLQEDSSNVNNQDNSAWHVDGKYESKQWGIHGGYREIEANYLAPGDWGQLGVERNPTNIVGFQVGGHLDLSSAFTLSANGEWDKGKSDAFGGATGFNTGTKINAWDAKLTWHVNSMLNLMFGYRNTEFTNLDPVVVAANPGNSGATYNWMTFGVGCRLSDVSKFLVEYQLSDISNDYQITKGGGGRFTGGLLSAQLGVKF